MSEVKVAEEEGPNIDKNDKDENEFEEEPEPLAMYSIQADFAQPKEYEIETVSLAYQPYTVTTTTNLNPCAEGLEDPVLLHDDSEKNEGVDINVNDNGADADINDAEDVKMSNPGCCRRYSCCFPLIIMTLIWMMMISAQAFEHCQDCLSTSAEYGCELQQRADYYCKSDRLQICCYYQGDECRFEDYPDTFNYSMGTNFLLSMFVAIAILFVSCVVPCSVPMMLYYDCRNRKYSKVRQTVFDVLCTTCFIFSSLCCSWTIFEYYKYPQNRCSTNGEIFGISNKGTDDNGLRQPNVWIMSQTTYSSFFALILLASFTICGSVTLLLQCIAKQKKKSAQIAQITVQDIFKTKGISLPTPSSQGKQSLSYGDIREFTQ